jgi:hypothetical protein
LNLCSHFVQSGVSYSSRAGECRSNSNLSSKSEKGEVEAVASVDVQGSEDFNTFGILKAEHRERIRRTSEGERRTKLRRDSSFVSLRELTPVKFAQGRRWCSGELFRRKRIDGW